ncbi:MAG: hypothetical protein IID53_12420 [Proteobacteria bacterium]|nr:hypothetical protein [Pseudomonadota bacterium]
MSRAALALKQLNEQRFLAAAVCKVAGIDGNTLTNFTRKTSLMLCSESRQGRPREFCLVDVYQLILMAELTRINRSPKDNALALNNALFAEAVWSIANLAEMKRTKDGYFIRDKDPAEMARRFCADIFTTPEPYWYRDMTRPIFASQNAHGVAINWHDALPNFDTALNHSGLVINVTLRLKYADSDLIEAITPQVLSRADGNQPEQGATA